MAFDELVTQYGPWSVSKAEVAYSCLRKFRLQYKDKIKEGAKHATARVGVAAHAMQDLALREALSPEALRLKAEEYADKEKLLHAERVELYSRLGAITDYGERIAKFKASVNYKAEFIEHKLAMKPDSTGCDFFGKDALLRGVIDQAIITDADAMVLIDHKSGKKQPIKNHSTQFYAYMAMALANFPDVTAIQCGINYVGAPRVAWFPRRNGQQGAWTRDEILKIVTPWVLEFLNNLRPRLVMIDDGRDKPAPGWQCEFCGFHEQCPEGKLTAELAKTNRAAKQAAKTGSKTNV